MYLHSKNVDNLKVPSRPTRAMHKVIFKTATKCTGKYLNSPLYKGVLLWNLLDSNIQKSNTVIQFVQYLKKMYDGYQELW